MKLEIKPCSEKNCINYNNICNKNCTRWEEVYKYGEIDCGKYFTEKPETPWQVKAWERVIKEIKKKLEMDRGKRILLRNMLIVMNQAKKAVEKELKDKDENQK